MRVAIHTKNKTAEHAEGRIALEAALKRLDIEVVDLEMGEEPWSEDEGTCDIDFMISIGGDGTLLSAVHRIGRSGIPVVGINFGHLGFLTTAGRGDIERLASCLKEGRYTIEPRTMLKVKVSEGGNERDIYALNEVYLHRRERRPLLHTQVFVNGEAAATYAADGIIVATPTGSTAYSLSCGGPILVPQSGCLVITPIAAHTLTQRPIVLSDSVHLTLCDEEKDIEFTLGVDSYVCTLNGDSIIEISKADFRTNIVRIESQNFFSAIRDKLMWGV